MRQIRWGLWLMAFGFTLFVAAQMMAEVNAGKPETDVKGCLCKYNPTSGVVNCLTPFIKTADKDAPSEDGEAEIWGYIVEDVGKYQHEVNENGQVKPVNVLSRRFIPADGRAHDFQTGSRSRKVICPCWR